MFVSWDVEDFRHPKKDIIKILYIATFKTCDHPKEHV